MRNAAMALMLGLLGCASVPETESEAVLRPSHAVARQPVQLIWTEESAADPNLLHLLRPRFGVNANHAPQAAQAFEALSNYFPDCRVPARVGYATWPRPDGVLVLFELRRSAGCPTTPAVFITQAGEAAVIFTPDQPIQFD